MTLAAGTRLGPYEILSPLGVGGMGEVFKARDTRLGREVAVKVLAPAVASNPEHLRRFEQEARSASALSDPHIVTVFDVGEEGGVHYFASELVDGGDLRTRLGADGIPVKKAMEIAEQIASGLASAHEKGITHRDLKPENILLTRSGTAKIADFGLAKLSETPDVEFSQMPTANRVETTEGVVMGTISYMSPEQAAGRKLDYRSDQFSFGLILYEMLSGNQAFRRETRGETLAAILRDEPPPIAGLNPSAPAPLCWVVERCLAKDPNERYASTRDLARELLGIRQHLSQAGSAKVEAAVARRPRRPLSRFAQPIVTAAAIIAAAFIGRGTSNRPPPSFQRLTFRRGTVTAARFAPDGQTVVYSAEWGGKPGEIFSVRPASPESHSIGVVDATLLAVSPSEELAVKLRPTLWSGQFAGTLARVALGGGAPREMMEGIQEADWSPDGSTLAIVRSEESVRWMVEFPPGKSLFEVHDAGVTGLRVSPDGKRIVVAEGGPVFHRRSLVLVDLAGRKKLLGPDGATGLAWRRKGDEVWFSADEPGGASSLWAIDLSGNKRLVLRHAGTLVLQDLSRNGAALVRVEDRRDSVMFSQLGAAREADLAWLDGTRVADISPDGRTLLLNEEKSGGGEKGAFYIRKTDGSPAIRLGDGFANALSPDGKWVLAQPKNFRNRLVLVPTGPGEPRAIPLPLDLSEAWFFPDGRRILVAGILPSGPTKLFSVDLEGKGFRSVAPDGYDTFFEEMPISPDGKWLAAISGPMGKVTLQLIPSDGGSAQPVRGFEPDDVVIRWSGDGRALFVFKRNQLPARVVRLDLATGKRTPWLELMPADPAGVTRIPIIAMTPDGRTYAYNFTRELSDLYLIRGLK